MFPRLKIHRTERLQTRATRLNRRIRFFLDPAAPLILRMCMSSTFIHVRRLGL